MIIVCTTVILELSYAVVFTPTTTTNVRGGALVFIIIICVDRSELTCSSFVDYFYFVDLLNDFIKIQNRFNCIINK